MLHISEVERLPLELLPGEKQLLGLRVEFVLDLVQVSVERANRVLQVIYCLVAQRNLPLVGANVVLEHGFFRVGSALLPHGRLQLVQELLLRRVEVLAQGPHSLQLCAQAAHLCDFGLQTLTRLPQLILERSIGCLCRLQVAL